MMAVVEAYLSLGVLVYFGSYALDVAAMGGRTFLRGLPQHLFHTHMLWHVPFAVLTWPWFVAFLMRRWA